MQLEDRVTGLEKKLANTSKILYVLVAISLGLLGSNLYLALQPNASFERIVVKDSIEIGDPQNRMHLGNAALKISGGEYGNVVLTPGMLSIDNTRLTSNELSLSSGSSMLVARVTDEEGKLNISKDDLIFSVILGGKIKGGTLTLLGDQEEVVSARVSKGNASVRASNSESSAELKP